MLFLELRIETWRSEESVENDPEHSKPSIKFDTGSDTGFDTGIQGLEKHNYEQFTALVAVHLGTPGPLSQFNPI